MASLSPALFSAVSLRAAGTSQLTVPLALTLH